MHGTLHEGRALTVNRANFRGTESSEKEDIDNSWKTVPIPPPSKRSSQTKKSESNSGSKKKLPATWDHWAGPVKETNKKVKDKKIPIVACLEPKVIQAEIE